MIDINKYTRSGVCFLLAAIIFLWTAPTFAIDLFGSKKHRIDAKVLRLLPDDLRNRWATLTAQADTGDIAEYITEGRLILKQLQKLVEVVGGEPPSPGDPSYPVFAGVLDDLVRLLDMVEMAAVLNMKDDGHLLNLLEEYRLEKEQLERDIRTDRQKLIEEGNERLKQQLRDPEYRRHPHRRTVVADLYFRVAELMYQEALAERDDEGEKWVALLEIDPAAAVAMGEPKMNIGPVLTMYQHIIDEFADTQYGQDALYNIAVLLAMSNDPNDKATSNQYLETLITLYSGNRYTLNALRRIGEYYFYPPINDLEKSVEIFTRIIENYSDTPEYNEALYKLGWAYYRIGEFDKGVEYFARTIDTDYDPEGIKIAKKSLKDFTPDALRYLGISYTVRIEDFPDGGIDGMVTWLENHPDRMRDYGTDALLTLGNIYYEDRQMYKEGVQTYDKFLELFPLEARSPGIHEKIVEIHLNENVFNPQRKLDEPKIFFDTYNPDSEWWAANTDENTKKRIIPLLEKYLDFHINDLLVLGVGMDMTQTNIEYLEMFEYYVRQYLRFWPNGPNAYTNHSNLAYILSKKLDRPMDGMKEYWQVATGYPDNKDDMEIACETVVGIAISFAQQEKAGKIFVSDEGLILPAEASPIDTTTVIADTTAKHDPLSLEPNINRTELLNSERMELSAFDLYTENFPNGKLIEIILYTAGSFLYEHDWIVEARPYLEKYIVDFPEGEYFKDSYKFLFDGYFKSVDLEGVEAICARIQSEDLPKELKDYVIEHKAVGILRNALGLQESENHIAAADEFVRLALEVPDYDKSANSLFLAGSEYTAGGAFEKANEAYLMLVERFPNFDNADGALWNVALNLRDQLEQFDAAARTFERMVDDYPNSKRVHDALSNASINYDEVKDHTSVIRINERFLKLYPDDPEADIYLYEMAEHFMATDDFESANNIYLRFAQKYPDDPRTIKAYYTRAIYYLEHDRTTLAKQEFQSTVDAHDRQVAAEMNGEPNYAAKSLSKLLAWEHEEYDKLRLKLPKGSLDASKERKREWRNSLIESYNKLISLGRKEGWQAFYAKGRLLDEEALVTYEQEIPYITKQDSAIVYLDEIVNSAILLNDVAIFQFKQGYGRLDTIGTQLIEQKADFEVDIERLKGWLAQAQLDTAAEGVQDSTKKLDLFRKAFAETDSSIIEAANWKDVCRQSIPEIAVRNGDYLYRSWITKFGWDNPESATEIRMIYQEEILKNIIIPGTPEVCGLYLQSIKTIQETGINTDYWINELNERFTHVIDTVLSLWDNQFITSSNKVGALDTEYKTMLAKDDEFAESKERFFLDMMGEQMLIWTDYFNEYNKDKLAAFSAILDTIIKYDRPIGFGDEALSRPLQSVLDNYNVFLDFAKMAVDRKTEYSTEYEENPTYYDDYYEEDVDRYWYDDAAVVYEDIKVTMTDYSVELLEEGLNVRDKYNLSGLTGVSILRKLVELKPDVYLERVGIEPQYFTIVTNSEDWLIWPEYENGFEQTDFDDSEWQHPHASIYPAGISLGKLDSLKAVPIWYNLDEPPALPEWIEYPDEVYGNEGELIEFIVVGVAPERQIPEAEYEEEQPFDEEITESAETDSLGIESTIEDTTFLETEQPVTEEESAELLSDLSIDFKSGDIPLNEVAFLDNGNGTASFMWSPLFNAAGEYTATFILYNFNIPMPLEIPIIVENVDRGFDWVGYPESYSTDEGMIAKFTVSGEDPDGDSLKLAFSTEDIPDVAEFIDNGDGSGEFIWETTYDDSGSYMALFTMSDGINDLNLEVPIVIINAIRAPKWTAFPDSVNGIESVFLRIDVAGSSPDGLHLTLTENSFDFPDDAVFTDNGDGTGIFDWIPDFESSGDYLLSLELTDGDTIIALTIPVHIGEFTRSPQWIDMPEQLVVDEGHLVDLTVIGEHPDNKELTLEYFSIDIPDTAAIFIDNGDGSGLYTWQTIQGDEGSYTASFILSDEDTSIISDVLIAIGGVALPPSWTIAPETDVFGNAGSMVEFTVGGYDPSGLALTIVYSSDNLPETALFVDQEDGTGSLTWQTTVEDTGSYNAKFDLSNGESSAAQLEVSIIIGSVAPPEWTSYPEEEISVNAGEPVEFSLSATDPGELPLTIEYSTENLPEAAQFTDYTDGTGAFSWQTTADDTGSFTASFNLSNGDVSASPVTVTITVIGSVAPPEWMSFPEEEITVNAGEPIEFSLSATDPGELPLTIEYSTENLPEAAQFMDYTDGTASFSWQTTVDDAGSFTASFNLSNGDVSASPVTVTISVIGSVAPPEWMSFPEEEIIVNAGEPIEFSLSATDPGELPLTIEYSTENLPEAAQFMDYTDGTASFSWQTTVDDAGSFSCSFNLSNGEVSASLVAVTITVIGSVAPPEWMSFPEEEIIVNAGDPVEFSLSATDPGELPLTIEYSTENLPEAAQFMDYTDGTGAFSWQTTADDAGSFTATFNLSNGEISASLVTVTITVIGSVAPPEWMSFPEEEITVNAGEPVEFSLSATDPGELPLTIEYSTENLPEAAQFMDYTDGTGAFSWQTTADDAGSFTATFNLSNGEISASPVTVTITIIGSTAPPEWMSFPEEEIIVNAGEPVEFSLSATDAGGLPLTIEYSTENLPETAQFTDYADGTASFNWQTTTEDAGNFTANFSLSNGEVSASLVTVTITIIGSVAPPEWMSFPEEEIIVNAGEPVEFSLSATDAGGLPLTIEYSTENLPESAQFTDYADGTASFNWQTTTEDAGSFTATFNLSNGEASADPVTVSITVVTVVIEPPEWVSYPEEEIIVNAGESVEFSLSATDPGELPLTIEYSTENLPEAAQFADYTDGTASFSWQTTADDAGSFTANFNLSNGETSANPVTVSINVVTVVIEPPEWVSYPEEEIIVNAGEPVEFSLSATDPGELPLTIEYSTENLPETAQFTDYADGTASFSWQTTTDDAGSFTGLFSLSNSEHTIQIEVKISVVEIEQEPEWIELADFYEIDEGSLLEFTIMGSGADPAQTSIEYSSMDIPESIIFTDYGEGTASFSWQPTNLDAGDYTAAFTLICGDKSIRKEVTITVNNIDQPPEWIDIPVEKTAEVSSLVEFTVMGVDYDADPITINFIPDNLPEAAIFNDSGDGSGTFTWQTSIEDVGSYTATFTLVSNTLSTEQTVTIIITEATQPTEEQETETPEGE